MWSIVWSIRGQIKHHASTFESCEKAHVFARYYKEIFERHRRVGYCRPLVENSRLSSKPSNVLTYRLIQQTMPMRANSHELLM